MRAEPAREGPRGPSLAAARSYTRPGGSLDLGPPDASRRSCPCAPRGAPVWLNPCRRWVQTLAAEWGWRGERFSLLSLLLLFTSPLLLAGNFKAGFQVA